jgi:ubiquinol-cytochrome c reductase subunit 7
VAALGGTHIRATCSYLPKEVQDKQTPFKFYLSPTLEQVKAERAERASLGAGQPYNRQLP